MAEIEDLRTFVAVAGARSFAGAARRLGLSAALVGRRVQALEERHGAKLIERTTRQHRLTPVGEAVLAKAREVIEALDELAEIARPDQARPHGRVRMAAPTTLGITALAPALAALAGRHPGLTVEMALSDRRVDLVAEGFDLAVRVGELPSSGLVARRVGTYRFAVCASPAHLERHGAPLAPRDLPGRPCVLNLNLVPRDRWPFRGPDGEPFSVEVGGQLEIDNGEALRAAALAGAGVIYAPRDLVAADLAQGRLVEVLAGWGTLTLPIHALHPSRRFVPRRVGAVIEAVAGALRA